MEYVLFSSDNSLIARYFVALRVLVRFTSSLFRRVFLRDQSPFVAAVFELLVVGFQLSTSQYLIIENSLCSYLVDHIILQFLYLYILCINLSVGATIFIRYRSIITSRVYAFFDNAYSFFKGCIFSNTVFFHEIYTFLSGIC